MLNPSRGRPDPPDGGSRAPGEAGGVEVHPDPEFYGYRPRGRRTTRSRHAANAAEVRLGFHLLRLPSGHAARNNKGQTFLAFPPAISKDL